MRTLKKNTLKSRILYATIFFSISNLPKNIPNLIFCSIKVAPYRTSMLWLWVAVAALSFFSFLTIAFPAIFHPLPRANDYVVLRLRGVGTHGPEGLLNPRRGGGGAEVPSRKFLPFYIILVCQICFRMRLNKRAFNSCAVKFVSATLMSQHPADIYSAVVVTVLFREAMGPPILDLFWHPHDYLDEMAEMCILSWRWWASANYLHLRQTAVRTRLLPLPYRAVGRFKNLVGACKNKIFWQNKFCY